MKYTKKFMYLLLYITCIIGFASLSACTDSMTGKTAAPTEATVACPTTDFTSEPTPIQNNSDWMADYPSILQEYRLFVDNMANGKYASVNEDGEVFVDDVFDAPVQGDLSYHWSCMMGDAIFWGGDSSMARDRFGYVLEDLNEDGIDELVLLQSDYTVLAVFSTVNGKAKLLDAYWSKYACAILDSGFLHTVGSDGAGVWVDAIKRLSPDGSELLNVVQYGSRSDKYPDDYYYRIENGKEEEINEAELDTYFEQYPFYKVEDSNYIITPQITTKNSGIIYIPLFSEQ